MQNQRCVDAEMEKGSQTSNVEVKPFDQGKVWHPTIKEIVEAQPLNFEKRLVFRALPIGE